MKILHPRTCALALLISLSPLLLAGEDVERVERGALVLENIPEIPDKVVERLDQYQSTRGAGFAGWLPDGGMLITTRFGETTQAHRVRTPLGTRSQLTFFEEPVRGVSVSPDADLDGFAYLYDIGGSEFTQIHWFDLASGETRMLTDGESRNGNILWSNSGDRFAYTSTRRDGRNFDVWIGTPDTDYEDHERVFDAEGMWGAMDWAPDDQHLLLLNYVSINEASVHLLDLESGELTEVNPSDERIGYGLGAFDRHGSGVYLVHNQGAEFRHLHHHDLESGEKRTLTGEIDWDVENLAMSTDRKTLAFTVNEEGMSRLHLLDLETGESLDGPDLPTGLAGGLAFKPDQPVLSVTLNTPRSPSDVHVFDLESGELERWTESEVGGLDTSRFPEPELIRYESFDGLEIPAWVYPSAAGTFSDDEASPVIIQIHGGPESQSRPAFSPLYAYWTNELGATVIRPNVRGSSGYGKTFLDLDNARKREDSVRDIGALLDWIESRPDLDEDRVIVYGGSYGGYMVLASLVHYDERLLGGVNIVGISNFVTFLENTEDYRRDLRRAEYGDERDPEMREFLEDISPLNNAEAINSPLFVAQGYNDPRVPYTESEQIVSTVRDNGGEVWYLLAMNEGHGFARKSNRDFFQAATILFFHQLFESD